MTSGMGVVRRSRLLPVAIASAVPVRIGIVQLGVARRRRVVGRLLRHAASMPGVATGRRRRMAALLCQLLLVQVPALDLEGTGLLVALRRPMRRLTASLCRRAVRPSHRLYPLTEMSVARFGSDYRISRGASTPRTSSPDAITCAQACTMARRARVRLGSSVRIKRKCGESLPRAHCPWNNEAKS